ncbi:transcription antitermination factor NusB [Peribacillus saganii]|uniref:Transcription antitermination protein NusB n=1 Tax=Peribacillus saganii TaxID=2303992 RepID=A0A372LQG1_9BACI|nr:transcription antitermination factor NusB [Peribacillus saganii]RFU69795.1 transcription antitermination factor NusB [Peribacillus saganii]
MKRRTAREKALQALFQMEIGKADIGDAMDSVLDGQAKDEYFEFLVKGSVENKEQIDTILRDNLENWKLERLGNIDRNLLRLSVFEMMNNEEVPVKVVMDEAIEIAKVFGDDQSSKFVNAVLSKVKEELKK